MKVTALGVGGAFTDRFYHTNYVVEIPDFRLLIDAGTTLRYSLSASGYEVTNINALALTHFHSDHVGGLEEFAQRCRYVYQHRPKIFVKSDQKGLLSNLFALHGAKPEDYLAVIEAQEPIVLKHTGEVQYELEYYTTVGLHAEVTSNYMIALRQISCDRKAKRIVFTGDIGLVEQSELGQLVADPETVAVFHDFYTGKSPTSAHPNLGQLTALYPQELRKKIYMIHYGDNIDEYKDEILCAGFKIAAQGITMEW